MSCTPSDLHDLSLLGYSCSALDCQHFAVVGKMLERRLCIRRLCLKYDEQAVVSNDSHMIPRWCKTANFVFTYFDISTDLQLMTMWDCSFSSIFHCL